jgi:hypothetical protein
MLRFDRRVISRTADNTLLSGLQYSNMVSNNNQVLIISSIVQLTYIITPIEDIIRSILNNPMVYHNNDEEDSKYFIKEVR